MSRHPFALPHRQYILVSNLVYEDLVMSFSFLNHLYTSNW
nr:MAG TPA: hypothetical protein [Caudoviricetes sp.]